LSKRQKSCSTHGTDDKCIHTLFGIPEGKSSSENLHIDADNIRMDLKRDGEGSRRLDSTGSEYGPVPGSFGFHKSWGFS
jgi:hypothetical protein